MEITISNSAIFFHLALKQYNKERETVLNIIGLGSENSSYKTQIIKMLFIVLSDIFLLQDSLHALSPDIVLVQHHIRLTNLQHAPANQAWSCQYKICRQL